MLDVPPLHEYCADKESEQILWQMTHRAVQRAGVSGAGIYTRLPIFDLLPRGRTRMWWDSAIFFSALAKVPGAVRDRRVLLGIGAGTA